MICRILAVAFGALLSFSAQSTSLAQSPSTTPPAPHIEVITVPVQVPQVAAANNTGSEHSYVMVHYVNAILEHVPLVTTLLGLISIDIIMGLVAAYISKRLSSTVSFKGMTKKAACVIIVGFAAVIEPMAQGMPLAKIVSLFYIFTESISILEAAAGCGIPLPPGLLATLVKLRDSEKALLPVTPPLAATQPPAFQGTTVVAKGPVYVSQRPGNGQTQRIQLPGDDGAERTTAIQENTLATQENTAAQIAGSRPPTA